MGDDENKPREGRNDPYDRFFNAFFGIVDKPVTFFKEKFVDPIQSKNKEYYYHKKYRRVPMIDECGIEDEVCRYEADRQFERDKKVDDAILRILRQRRLECEHFYGPDSYPDNCQKVKADYLEAEENLFTKYGDIGPVGKSREAYMKQKHRLLWERRHGPVGTGMKTSSVGEDSH